ncbi:MAG TPA: cation-transporting P-type ATPase [Candidatus Saccharimonadales bacterium]|nr:cation-transporting P-type ATPase [Candidatus Saccharimonadales bacterium]
MLYYKQSVSETLHELDTSAAGLTTNEYKKRLEKYGSNQVRVKGEPLWRKIIEPFASVFMLILFVAAGISLLHHDMLDAIIILVIIFVTATIYYVQRFSTDRILRSLQKHTAQAVEVYRDGKSIQVDATQLVPGDVITLTEGEKVPADARLIAGSSVRMDESLLTGESVPISKTTGALRGDKEIYERTNLLFQGSFIVSGEATAVIVTTGNETEFGQLAALTQNINTASPVQEKIDKLISQIVAVVGGVAIVAFGLALNNGMELAESLKFVMALAVSAVPEGLPVAISVVLVLGMRRMAAKKALIRNMRAIETVGALTTIATDKTGTLTKNKLTVQEAWQPKNSTVQMTSVVAHAINHGSHKSHDPLDIALIDYVSAEKATVTNKPLSSLPFDQSVAMSGNIWHHGKSYQLMIKGAPEHVLSRSDLTDSEHEQATAALHHLTAQGYRVIAIAQTTLTKDITAFSDLSKKDTLEFIGFIAIADVLRPEAKRAVAAALKAGVSVRMITGDHFETAYHIAQKLGMVTDRSQVFDSRRMNVMTDEELTKVIDDIRVFSRVIPEHKYRILSILKQKHITAMTGDGVNDVPALANAHVGVAMGSGSQIAKDAGDIILLDDNFRSIIDAMREGRTIIANIRRMLFYLLSTSAGEVMAMLGAMMMGLPIPILPVQILWINLVTDTSMVIPLGLEPGEKNNMTQKPKPPNAPILSKLIIVRMILIAFSMAATALILYVTFSAQYGQDYARTIAFSALVVMQWSNAFNARSEYESIFTRIRVFNGKFYIGLTIAVTLQALAVFGPLQDLLHIHTVSIGDLMFTGAIAFVVPIIVCEIHKYFSRHLVRKNA